MMLDEFTVGRMYSNEQIFKTLKVSNAGGIRISKDGNIIRHVVIMTSSPEIRKVDENPYHDRIEGDILTYTAAGKTGDQFLSGHNQYIPEQFQKDFPIFAFEIMSKRSDKTQGASRWRFLGLLEYLRHYPESQIDIHGNIRKVWMFEFRIHRNPEVIPVNYASRISTELLHESRSNDAVRGG